jgi:hypothetical protein
VQLGVPQHGAIQPVRVVTAIGDERRAARQGAVSRESR